MTTEQSCALHISDFCSTNWFSHLQLTKFSRRPRKRETEGAQEKERERGKEVESNVKCPRTCLDSTGKLLSFWRAAIKLNLELQFDSYLARSLLPSPSLSLCEWAWVCMQCNWRSGRKSLSQSPLDTNNRFCGLPTKKLCKHCCCSNGNNNKVASLLATPRRPSAPLLRTAFMQPHLWRRLLLSVCLSIKGLSGLWQQRRVPSGKRKRQPNKKSERKT